MDFYGSPSSGNGNVFSQAIDMREEMHNVIFGNPDVPAQGQPVILREFNDTVCPGCWDPIQGGSRRLNCRYCQGEGYQFTERMVTMVLFAGVAPVYKPSILGTGQYPLTSYGNSDPNRYTGYCEWDVYPDYDKYTLPKNKTPDKLYQVKVDGSGNVVYGSDRQPVRAAKWKILAPIPILGDQGRVEYFELGLIKEVVS